MSADLRQLQRMASFTTPLGQDVFSLVQFEADEALSELFTFSVEASSKTENADLQSIMSQKCSVKMALKNGTDRIFNGTLVAAEWVGKENDLYLYRFTLRPWLWLLSQRADCRIFKNKTAIEIIKQIFGKEESASFEDRTSDALQPIEYCVQYRETDLAFVLRLMEQYGIYYYFKHIDGDHKLVLSDSRSSHDRVQPAAQPSFAGAGSAYPLMPASSRNPRHIEHMTHWSTMRRLRTGKIALKDYDFEQSGSDLTARAEEGFDKAKSYEAYDYPRTYTVRDEGEHFARVRAQAQQAADDRRHASGDAPSLCPGSLMTLAAHQTASENIEYLVVRARHTFSGQSYRSGSVDESLYGGSYELQKSDRRFRAPLATPRPTVHGPHTAKVVGEGNEGEEGDIDVDEFGRIFLRFHWDREDGSTSCRTRVAQMWSGRNWGGQVIPRIGQEVVVEFLEGNPDLPLVTGTVVNDQHKPPYDLPGNKTQSGLKSESTDGAGFADCYNEIKFEDRKGAEVFSLQAEKDHEVLVKNKETREIGPDYADGGYSRETTLKNGNDKLHVQNGKLDVEALTEINLKVGESTIKMLPASIEISSPTITIKSVAKTEVLSDAMVIVNGALVKIN
ncbi:type VI secretion system Vgr family protein [Bosea sp. (in: a-proteobacteria)]|uniref:type VI secretion system Vgr family protein n=1 Tax=Bosea sp. (in: a-proteobacteria) TaxID=1871050 RepID=UPI00273291B9|nr:type VI secretion system tip protein TssI/VgrG [Bosea sp. (in: a-proteobacteria)]MDP3410996.1 type VI secretion system tip protein TssI/VgrG [Bosea sp. (in: a-proteobacteria)]